MTRTFHSNCHNSFFVITWYVIAVLTVSLGMESTRQGWTILLIYWYSIFLSCAIFFYLNSFKILTWVLKSFFVFETQVIGAFAEDVLDCFHSSWFNPPFIVLLKCNLYKYLPYQSPPCAVPTSQLSFIWWFPFFKLILPFFFFLLVWGMNPDLGEP